jgi:hypothetical protein
MPLDKFDKVVLARSNLGIAQATSEQFMAYCRTDRSNDEPLNVTS